jgi:AcrR family transcriptional regulator
MADPMSDPAGVAGPAKVLIRTENAVTPADDALTGAQDAVTAAEKGARRRPGPVPLHSRDKIAGVAVQLADAGGLRTASMRAVAARLDTGVASLYRYVTTRDELVDLMIDAALADLDLVTLELSGDWQDDLREVGRRVLDVFGRHPWLSSVPGVIHVLGPHIAEYLDVGLGIVAELAADTRSKLEAIALMGGVLSLFDRHLAAGSPSYRLAPMEIDLPNLARAVGELAGGRQGAEATDPTEHLLDLAVRVVDGLLRS